MVIREPQKFFLPGGKSEIRKSAPLETVTIRQDIFSKK